MDCEKRAELLNRRYSGTIMLRLSPELHRDLTIQAKEQGVSLNHWITERLALALGGVS